MTCVNYDYCGLLITKVWLCGNTIQILHFDGNCSVVEPTNADVISSIFLIDGDAWMIRGKNIQIWDLQTRSVKKTFGGVDIFGRGVSRKNCSGS